MFLTAPSAGYKRQVVLVAPSKGLLTMAKGKRQWSFREQRQLVELAQTKSLEQISSVLKRSPESVMRAALRLGVSIRQPRRLKRSTV
jgi:hypothetical protein